MRIQADQAGKFIKIHQLTRRRYEEVRDMLTGLPGSFRMHMRTDVTPRANSLKLKTLPKPWFIFPVWRLSR